MSVEALTIRDDWKGPKYGRVEIGSKDRALTASERHTVIRAQHKLVDQGCRVVSKKINRGGVQTIVIEDRAGGSDCRYTFFSLKKEQAGPREGGVRAPRRRRASSQSPKRKRAQRVVYAIRITPRYRGYAVRNERRKDVAAVKRTFSRKNANRPSPSLSARIAYDMGRTRSIGNDGNVWRISVASNGTARWVRA